MVGLWLEGEPAAAAVVNDWRDFAMNLAHFLKALQSIDATNGLVAGVHS
jgi:aminoglycoside phosphotransferase (APT) family kinase protein